MSPLPARQRMPAHTPTPEDPEHAERCARAAAAVFDVLSEQLGLSEDDRDIVVLAAYYHDLGYLRSAGDHARKSYDMLLELDIAGMDEVDRLILASAARYHGQAEPSIEHAGFGMADAETQRRIRRIAAIVKLAAASDASHLGVVEELVVELRDDRVHCTLIAAGEPSIERDRMREALARFRRLTYMDADLHVDVRRPSIEANT